MATLPKAEFDYPPGHARVTDVSWFQGNRITSSLGAAPGVGTAEERVSKPSQREPTRRRWG
jgi:hypothetical protein